jgi:hypothetical protein
MTSPTSSSASAAAGAGGREILGTKGYNPLEEVKAAAARRWVDAVNADGRFGRWEYRIVHGPAEVRGVLDSCGVGNPLSTGKIRLTAGGGPWCD